MENFFKNSIKKVVTGAAFVGAMAGSSAKMEAQNIKVDKNTSVEHIDKNRTELPPIYVSDINDPKLKVYKDSLAIYELSKKVEMNSWNYPEVSKDEYVFYQKKNADENPEYSFDRDKYNSDKKLNQVKDFKDYIYSYKQHDHLANYKEYEKNLRLVNDAYNRNYPIKDDTPDKEVILKNGNIKIYQTDKGEILDKGMYSEVDPQTGTTKSYIDSKLEGVYNDRIRPARTRYFCKKEKEAYQTISLENSSTGWYRAGEEKPKFKTNSKDEYINYSIPGTMYNEYKKPIQPIIYTKDKNLLAKNKPETVKALDEAFQNTFVKKVELKHVSESTVEKIKSSTGPVKYKTEDKIGNKYYFIVDSSGFSKSVKEQEYDSLYKNLKEVKYEDFK